MIKALVVKTICILLLNLVKQDPYVSNKVYTSAFPAIGVAKDGGTRGGILRWHLFSVQK